MTFVETGGTPEGRWTVSWCAGYHADGTGAWVITSPEGYDQDCHWDWATALKWCWEYVRDEAEAAADWNEGQD